MGFFSLHAEGESVSIQEDQDLGLGGGGRTPLEALPQAVPLILHFWIGNETCVPQGLQHTGALVKHGTLDNKWCIQWHGDRAGRRAPGSAPEKDIGPWGIWRGRLNHFGRGLLFLSLFNLVGLCGMMISKGGEEQ